MANLVRHMCDFSCHAEQSKFIDVKEFEKSTTTGEFLPKFLIFFLLLFSLLY